MRRIILLALILSLLATPVIAQDPFPTISPTPTTQYFEVSGIWHYVASGSINNTQASDTGTCEITALGPLGGETITKVVIQGTVTNLQTGESASYTSTWTGESTLGDINGYRFDADSLAYTLYPNFDQYTQTGNARLDGNVIGRQGSTGYEVSMGIRMSRDYITQPPTGGSSGGCFLGFSPLALLLLVPVVTVLGKK